MVRVEKYGKKRTKKVNKRNFKKLFLNGYVSGVI